MKIKADCEYTVKISFNETLDVCDLSIDISSKAFTKEVAEMNLKEIISKALEDYQVSNPTIEVKTEFYELTEVKE